MSAIARYYIAEKNPDGAFLPGVPLRDLTAEEYDALPVWLQLSIDASDFYRATKPRTETAPLKAPKERDHGSS